MKHAKGKIKDQKSKIKNKSGWYRNAFPTFISSIPHHKRVFQKSVGVTFFVVLFGLLAANILSSQIMSSLYFGLVNDDQSAIVRYLKLIRSTPSFPKEAIKFDAIHGKPLSSMIFQEENQRNNEIKILEQLLKDNPDSRDILYSLYLVYSQKGDALMSQKYLRQVKAIDPSL